MWSCFCDVWKCLHHHAVVFMRCHQSNTCDHEQQLGGNAAAAMHMQQIGIRIMCRQCPCWYCSLQCTQLHAAGFVPGSAHALRVVARDRNNHRSRHLQPLRSVVERVVVYLVQPERPFVALFPEQHISLSQGSLTFPPVGGASLSLPHFVKCYNDVYSDWLIGIWIKKR